MTTPKTHAPAELGPSGGGVTRNREKPTAVALYCTCGDSMTGSASPAVRAAEMVDVWLKAHTGPGHAACDARTAANARRRIERAEMKRACGDHADFV